MKKDKIINKIFLSFIILIMAGGFLKPLIDAVGINEIENRVAYQVPNFTFDTFLNGQYQNQFENAYADQIPLSYKMKRAKNISVVILKIAYLTHVSHGLYKDIGGVYLIDDYLIYFLESLEGNKQGLDVKINNLNNIQDKLKNIDIYAYYVEKDMDINFENNEKSGSYEYLASKLDSKIKTSKLTINNLNDYKKYFFKTDHHWNYAGSYQGYLDIIKLLGVNEEGVNHSDLICTSSVVDGSKARMIGAVPYFNEKFCGYKYDLPKHEVYLNGALGTNYTDIDTIFETNPKNASYGLAYGWDYGLIRFNYNNPSKPNLLIIGDSFDNAINELVASHFNNTYNVDLRHYKEQMGEEFDIIKFVQNNEIDKILFIGNIGFYSSDQFLINVGGEK